MTPRRVLILGALALLAIAGALWLSHERVSSGDAQANALLYPSLRSELGAIKTIRIYKGGAEATVEMQRSDDGWTVAQASGYAADTAKVNKLLLGIAEAKILEEKTSNPENYATLGVENPDQPDASSVRVELIGGAKPVDLLIGKQAAGASSQYVRRTGEQPSWLVNSSFDTSETAAAWLRKDILNISADRIQSANVTIGNDKPYSAAKDARTDSNFSLTGLPKGKKLSAPSAANAFATALASLTLSNVEPDKDLIAQKRAAQATFKTFDGLEIQLEGWTRDDQRFIAVKADFDAEQAKRFHVATTAPTSVEGEAQTPPPPAEDSQKKVREEAEAINARVQGWAYEIPDYKYEAIFKPLDEMLEK